MVTTIGSGGVYRKCPPSMEKGATCENKALLAQPDLVCPILSGMQAVMTRGTGQGLSVKPGLPAGLRVYGKTGTADAIGIDEERPWHVEKGVYGKPHSWFVALAEPAATPVCHPTAAKRLGLALVIPRGGLGALNAGPAAIEVIHAMYKLELFGKPEDLVKAAAAAPSAPSPAPAPAPSPSAAPAH